MSIGLPEHAISHAYVETDSYNLEAERQEAPGQAKFFIQYGISVRGLGEIVVLIVWTGISAVILEGGRTAHSRFKLPVPILDNSSCAVRHNTKEGQFLKAAKIIIWDECTMTPHHALSVVQRFDGFRRTIWRQGLCSWW
ncbi:ATP-dependent DNA helicase [Trichonephila inaurata madagascariensis]|uniref:ATP-dependent DNA helicase n=1 Tax=Trichonephila inaurata madagascariensis TaxID=2747483 RepID=A0A8X6IW69_9ARAC|nr:ATP-dependent DNA helicase [Trichonephila inaurata madagascariensis]